MRPRLLCERTSLHFVRHGDQRSQAMNGLQANSGRLHVRATPSDAHETEQRAPAPTSLAALRGQNPKRCDAQALMGEVIGHCEVLQAPSARKAVADDAHVPHLVDGAGQLQRHPLVDQPPSLLAPAHSQPGIAVSTDHPLVANTGKLRAQQRVNVQVAEAAMPMIGLHDLLVSFKRRLIGL